MACFHRQIFTGTGKRIEDPQVTGEVLTIIGGRSQGGDSRKACDMHTKEARSPPWALVHKADKHPTRNSQ